MKTKRGQVTEQLISVCPRLLISGVKGQGGKHVLAALTGMILRNPGGSVFPGCWGT